MSTYRCILTHLGRALIANAIANGTAVELQSLVVGDGNGNDQTPSEEQTALVRQVWSGNIDVFKVDLHRPTWIIIEAAIPPSVGGWTIREVGVKDVDGNLVAVANFPATYKPVLEEGSTRDLIVRLIFEVANSSAVTVSIDPNVSIASRQWVIDNFSLAALIPGGVTYQVLRKKSNTAGDVEWYDPTSGLTLLVDVIEEHQTLADSQTEVILASTSTAGLAIFVDGVRLRNNQWTSTGSTTLTLSQSYTAGTAITFVQNEPSGSLDFLRTINSLSEIETAGSSAQSAARAALGLTGATFLDQVVLAVRQADYPVGEIMITRREGNPTSWMGFGTWERYASGRVLTGFDVSDADFNALDKTGGEKAHQQTLAELVPHLHKVNPPATTTSSDGSHTHTVAHHTDSNLTGSTIGGASANNTSSTTSAAGVHTHSVDIPEFDSGSSGGGAAMNILQPYCTVYMWKRTA
jgi:hypothetical protein